jgi:lipooligosaccharide transport system ATP-binding protein
MVNQESKIIDARQVEKKFGDFRAVDGVDVHVLRGECFGLLGPNGAGKSTFISMIYGAVIRSAGEMRVFGFDPLIESRDIKKRIGVVTQENALDEGLTVRENMVIYSAFLGVPKASRGPRVDELLRFMSLDHKAHAPIVTLSGGMKRRLAFVRALLGTPELVILDEPTTGLDPAVRHLIWGKVKQLRAEGATILLTTHYMHEAEILCDRVAIMNKGKILQIETPQNLIDANVPGFVAVFPRSEDIEQKLDSLGNGFLLSRDHSGVYCRASRLEDLVALQTRGLTALQIRPANLEDVFLKLTGQEINIDA